MERPVNSEPTEQDLRRALVRPGFELPSTVTKHKSVILTRGLQPEDLGVLDFLKLRDPSRPATKEQLAQEMQEQGWKMGKTRFDGIFTRLKAAGHIKHHCPFNSETGRPEWVIEFFLEPSNNDQYVNSGIQAFSQVNAETPETGDPAIERPFETLETRKTPGQRESPVSRDPEANPWKPAFPSAHVSAGQSRNAESRVSGSPPPHPPEEVDTSSPYPLTGGPSSHTSQEGEEAGCFAPKDLAAAEDLLQDLDRPWTLDRQQATKSAPELLAVLAAQGWPGIREMSETDVLLLRRELTANPGGVKSSHRKVLVKNRIPELLRYSVVIRSAQGTRVLVGAQDGQAGAAQPGPVPSGAASGLRAEGGIPWCGACNKGERPAEYFQRTVERPDGSDVPCRVCHPKYATRA